MQRARRQRHPAAEVAEASATMAREKAAATVQQQEGEYEGEEREECERTADSLYKKGRKKKAANRETKSQMKQHREAAHEELDKKKTGIRTKEENREAEREERRLGAEEEEQRLLEEKKKAEREEYDQWKDMFSTDEQGRVDEDISEESRGLLQEFVDYIKTHKVVVLEELAREFGLRTEDVVNRVRGLEQMGYITGVIDDRGKFICISEAEMKAVAKFIQQKGRITVAELAREINKLINLSDKTVDK